MADATSISGETMLVVLGIATIWGEQVIKTQRGSKQITDIDEVLTDMADDLNALRAKYEAGNVLNANQVSDQILVAYRDELNNLTEKYRVKLFRSIMTLVGNPLAIDDMLTTYGTIGEVS